MAVFMLEALSISGTKWLVVDRLAQLLPLLLPRLLCRYFLKLPNSIKWSQLLWHRTQFGAQVANAAKPAAGLAAAVAAVAVAVPALVGSADVGTPTALSSASSLVTRFIWISLYKSNGRHLNGITAWCNDIEFRRFNIFGHVQSLYKLVHNNDGTYVRSGSFEKFSPLFAVYQAIWMQCNTKTTQHSTVWHSATQWHQTTVSTIELIKRMLNWLFCFGRVFFVKIKLNRTMNLIRIWKNRINWIFCELQHARRRLRRRHHIANWISIK